ncbi:hypothetical protein J3F84DRAFT_305727 [Trichoderma pleuroticola]
MRTAGAKSLVLFVVANVNLWLFICASCQPKKNIDYRRYLALYIFRQRHHLVHSCNNDSQWSSARKLLTARLYTVTLIKNIPDPFPGVYCMLEKGNMSQILSPALVLFTTRALKRKPGHDPPLFLLRLFCF